MKGCRRFYIEMHLFFVTFGSMIGYVHNRTDYRDPDMLEFMALLVLVYRSSE